MVRHRSLFILFLLLTLPLAGAGQGLGDPNSELLVQSGLKHLYNLEYAEARNDFARLRSKHAEHPAGLFFTALAQWWEILLDPAQATRDESLLGTIETTVALCDRRLEANETDLIALFYKGGAIGLRGRLYAMRENWMKAAGDGRLLLPLMESCARFAPANADLAFATGFYQYFADAFPERYPVVKPFMLLFPKGDKQQGIEQLRHAARHAHYSSIEASYFLLQIFHSYEGRQKEALEIALALAEQFPHNPLFQRYAGRCAHLLGEAKKAEEIFRSIIGGCAEQRPGYTPAVEQEARFYLGLLAMRKGKLDEALASFTQSILLATSVSGKEHKPLLIQANLRMGMIYDLQKKRKLALDQYKKVLGWEDIDGSRESAQKYTREPFKK